MKKRPQIARRASARVCERQRRDAGGPGARVEQKGQDRRRGDRAKRERPEDGELPKKVRGVRASQRDAFRAVAKCEGG